MAYTRQYPNSITPNGSTTRSCLENDDKELKRVLGLISDVGGLMLSGTKRQCVLYGSTDSSGNPNFLTASGLNVSIDGSSKPVILSFANGFSATSGTLDTLDAIKSAVSSAWTIPANSTYYLYIEKDMSTGLLSYGRTANEDTYSKAAPSSPVLDQCYFNTNEMKMYHYNGSAWEQKWRIFVAKAVSTDSAVTLTQYPMESKAFIRDNLNVETINGTLVSSLSPHTLKRSIAYAVGDIAYSTSLPSWARLECVTAGTTASIEPDFSSVSTGGVLLADGGVKWIVDDIRDATPVGAVSGRLYLPAGYVKCNGATVKRADYPRLVALATAHSLWTSDTTANCGLFGVGDGSATMVLPNWMGVEGYANDNIGQYIFPGVPEITGGYSRGGDHIDYGAPYSPYGAISADSSHVDFKASRSSPIYGRSATVQPAAVKMLPIIRY